MNAPFTNAQRARTTGQRILSVWFPYLATERIWRQRLGRAWRSTLGAFPPLVISHTHRNAQRLAALDPRAEALKLRRGMGLADARAMHPRIDVVEADPQADLRLLESLADWCDRYTPLVALDGKDGLFLDITGCSHLFGGEAALIAEMTYRFREQGFDARIAVAATAGTAWAVARFHDDSTVPDGAEADRLAPLPLAALRLDHTVCIGLESVGLRTVSSIMAAPRAPLARRFGKALLLRLDQALGQIDEVISPRMPAPELSAERRFAEPIMTVEDVERIVLLLAGSLCEALERREAGARALRLCLFRVDGAVSHLSVGLSRPARAPDWIGRLFHERLAALGGSLDAGYGFDLVRLSVLSTGPLAAKQGDFASSPRDPDADLALLVDRVGARLGSGAIRRPVPFGSHLPERAVVLSPYAETPEAKVSETAHSEAERPLRLLAQPEQVNVTAAEVPEGPPMNFRWRRAFYRIVRAEGPERLSPEWWLEGLPVEKEKGEEEEAYKERCKQAAAMKTAQSTRDYFRVEDADGRRYWLYRQGLYGASEKGPRWFLHGLCA